MDGHFAFGPNPLATWLPEGSLLQAHGFASSPFDDFALIEAVGVVSATRTALLPNPSEIDGISYRQ